MKQARRNEQNTVENFKNKLTSDRYQSAAKPGETIIAESTVQKTTRNLAFINTKVYRKTDNMSIATGQDTKTFLPAE